MTYQEAMGSEYSTNWVYVINHELSGLEGAETFGVA